MIILLNPLKTRMNLALHLIHCHSQLNRMNNQNKKFLLQLPIHPTMMQVELSHLTLIKNFPKVRMQNPQMMRWFCKFQIYLNSR